MYAKTRGLELLLLLFEALYPMEVVLHLLLLIQHRVKQMKPINLLQGFLCKENPISFINIICRCRYIYIYIYIYMLLTSEKVVFQASLLHVFIDKEVFLVFPTIAQELNQVRMRELPQEFYFRL